jgi:hypothetical protein
LSYGDSMKPGAQFLKARVDAFKAAKGTAAPAAAAPEAAPEAAAAGEKL